MSIKNIRQHNAPQFIEDLKKVREVMAYAAETKYFFKTTKMQVREEAAYRKISYYITDKIFVVKRNVMVII